MGNITETDVLAAVGEKAFIIGFKVTPGVPAQALAKKDDIKILTYDIIYELTDDLTQILLDSIEPDRVEMLQGKATVVKVFREERNEKIVGMKVVSGEAQTGNVARFYRDGQLQGEGRSKIDQTFNQRGQTSSSGK